MVEESMSKILSKLSVIAYQQDYKAPLIFDKLRYLGLCITMHCLGIPMKDFQGFQYNLREASLFSLQSSSLRHAFKLITNRF